jgi:PPOX class probable FMN-dependent enzyme
MKFIKSIAELEALYGTPRGAAISKVSNYLTPLYAKWIETSRFCVLSTVGPNGTDGSPRGDDGSVVFALNSKTLAIVMDDRVSLMFMVSGSSTIVRVNGIAALTADDQLRRKFARGNKKPSTIIVINITEVYTQCAKAVIRAALWQRNDTEGLPSPSEIIAEVLLNRKECSSIEQKWPQLICENRFNCNRHCDGCISKSYLTLTTACSNA